MMRRSCCISTCFLFLTLPLIAEWVADDFTYTELNGTRHIGWLASVEILTAEVAMIADLQFQSIALIENQVPRSGTITDKNLWQKKQRPIDLFRSKLEAGKNQPEA